jgi:hypothetical protein
MKVRTALMFALAAGMMTPALAEAPAISRNAKILSADGSVLGKVDRVLMNGEKVSGVQLIFGSKMIVIPGDTVTVDETGVKTTLTKKQVRALR